MQELQRFKLSSSDKAWSNTNLVRRFTPFPFFTTATQYMKTFCQHAARQDPSSIFLSSTCLILPNRDRTRKGLKTNKPRVLGSFGFLNAGNDVFLSFTSLKGWKFTVTGPTECATCLISPSHHSFAKAMSRMTQSVSGKMFRPRRNQ